MRPLFNFGLCQEVTDAEIVILLSPGRVLSIFGVLGRRSLVNPHNTPGRWSIILIPMLQNRELRHTERWRVHLHCGENCGSKPQNLGHAGESYSNAAMPDWAGPLALRD